MRRSFLLTLALASALPAYADLIEFGAVTRCSPKEGIFEVGALVHFNEQITILSSKLAGTRQLSYGEHKLNCRLGKTKIAATVNVFRPSNGHCMGAGFAQVSHFSIDGQRDKDLWNRAFFNFQCSGEKILTSLAVKVRNDLEGRVGVTRCEADDWSWDAGFVGLECTMESPYGSDQSDVVN